MALSCPQCCDIHPIAMSCSHNGQNNHSVRSDWRAGGGGSICGHCSTTTSSSLVLYNVMIMLRVCLIAGTCVLCCVYQRHGMTTSAHAGISYRSTGQETTQKSLMSQKILAPANTQIERIETYLIYLSITNVIGFPMVCSILIPRPITLKWKYFQHNIVRDSQEGLFLAWWIYDSSKRRLFLHVFT